MKTDYARSLRTAAAIAMASAITFLVGCAAFGGPEAAVKSRANEFWHARLEGRPDKAYELTTPSHRKLQTLKQYRAKFAGLGASAAEVHSVTCEAERCVARIKLAVQPGIAMLKLDNIDMYMDDVWVREDGQWWHFEQL